MNPYQVAADDVSWKRYLDWLDHFQVLHDEIELLTIPGNRHLLAEVPDNLNSEFISADEAQPVSGSARLSAEQLPVDQRALVVAWTWPDRTFAVSNAYEYSVLLPVKNAAHDEIRAQHMSLIVGAELLLRMVQVSTVTGLEYRDIYTHLSGDPIGRSQLESLQAGLCCVNISTLLIISRRLGLKFQESWTIEDPDKLRSDVRRSVEIARLVETCEHLSIDNLLAISDQATTMTDATPDASVRPAQFNKQLRSLPSTRSRSRRRVSSTGKYGPLFEALYNDGRRHPTYSFDAIDEILKGRTHSDLRTAEGLPGMALESTFWWGNGSAAGNTQIRAWQDAGFRVEKVDLDARTVRFGAEPGREAWWPLREEFRTGRYRPPSIDAQTLPSPKGLRAETIWTTRASAIAQEMIEEKFIAGAQKLFLTTNLTGSSFVIDLPDAGTGTISLADLPMPD